MDPDEIRQLVAQLNRNQKKEDATSKDVGSNDAFRDSDDIDYAVGRLINQGQVADGPSLPRPVHGEFRVPFPTGFMISGTPSQSFTGTIFTLKWTDCTDPYVNRYQIYVRNVLDENTQPALLGSAEMSPFTARVDSNVPATVVFYLQPVMNNGQALPISRCPTCTGITLDLRPTGTLPIEVHPTTVSGSLAYSTQDNVTVYQLDFAADTTINVWTQIPYDIVTTNNLVLGLAYAPDSAPGVTNNKVKIKLRAKVNNTLAAETAGDTIALANSTDWATYLGTVNIVAAGTYAAGDFLQLRIHRDTSVTNNATVNFGIASIFLTYTLNS